MTDHARRTSTASLPNDSMSLMGSPENNASTLNGFSYDAGANGVPGGGAGGGAGGGRRGLGTGERGSGQYDDMGGLSVNPLYPLSASATSRFIPQLRHSIESSSPVR
jgi:hypothetical protein